MRAQRRFAPTGGRFRPEWVAGISGIRNYAKTISFINILFD